MKKYILFYSFDDHGIETLFPVFKKAQRQFDCTLLQPPASGLDCHSLKERRWGLMEKNFTMKGISVARKPDAVVGFRLWWGPDIDLALAANMLKIPVIMVNHGHMFVYNERQTYKRNFGPAAVNCIWGHWDYILWRRWTDMPLEITGNPLHDLFPLYDDCEPATKKKNYALLLTPRGQRKRLNESAENLKEIMPVVASCHPLDKEKDYYRERYETHTDAWKLLPLIYHSSLIISNVTSSLIPALYWQKPVFIHSSSEPWYHFDEFRDNFVDVFNFRTHTDWTEEYIADAICPGKNDYLTFGNYPDGRNSQRVLNVIKRYL